MFSIGRNESLQTQTVRGRHICFLSFQNTVDLTGRTLVQVVTSCAGVGRIDIVESRYVGMKSRGCYETPGGTILYHAHRAMESISLDRGELHLKDDMSPRYAEMIYNGFWYAASRCSSYVLQSLQRNKTAIRLLLKAIREGLLVYCYFPFIVYFSL